MSDHCANCGQSFGPGQRQINTGPDVSVHFVADCGVPESEHRIKVPGAVDLLPVHLRPNEAERLLLAMVERFADEHGGDRERICEKCNAVEDARAYLVARGLLKDGD